MRNKRADGRCYSYQDSNTGLCCVMNFVSFDLFEFHRAFKSLRKGGGGGGHRIKHGRAFAGVPALRSLHRLHSPTCMDVEYVLLENGSNMIGPSNQHHYCVTIRVRIIALLALTMQRDVCSTRFSRRTLSTELITR